MKMVDYVTLGKRIKRLRRMHDWTQEKLGDMTGYSKSFIGCVENHSSTPSLETVVKIAAALGVTPDYLLMGTAINTERNQRIMEKLNLCTPEDQETIEILVDALMQRRPNQQTK